MELLIDYLQNSAEQLIQYKEQLKKLKLEFQRVSDPDIKNDIREIKQKIRKKIHEIKDELLLRLEEFKCIKKYYPDLFLSLLEDETIGKILSTKIWLMNFRELQPEIATRMLIDLKNQRAKLKEARIYMRGWYGLINSEKIIRLYPILKWQISDRMNKDEVLSRINEIDKKILREGWLLLLTEALIKIPLAKFIQKLRKYNYLQSKAKKEFLQAKGKGTIMEFDHLCKLEKITKKVSRYERMIKSLLLANPDYLKSLKNRKSWLTGEKGTTLAKLAQVITPYSVREKLWLDQMRKRLRTLEHG